MNTGSIIANCFMGLVGFTAVAAQIAMAIGLISPA